MTPVPSSRRVRCRRVADEDRKRAPRACTRCKARKSKCIETPSGICHRCQQGSHACSFDRQETPATPDASQATAREVTPPRGLSPAPIDSGSVVQGLENHGPARRDLCSDGDAPESFMWPRFLSRLRNAFYLEPQPPCSEKETTRLESHLSRTSAVHQSAEALRLQSAIDSLPPKPVADFLVKLCIRHGTDCFFYFDQTVFLSELTDFYGNLNSPLRRDASFVCLLLSVLSLGSQWTPRARPEAISAPPLSSEGDPGNMFCGHARVLLADTMDRVSIYSVKAAFLLGVYLMPSSAIGASYLYMGLALRKALALGLHQEVDDPEMENNEKEMRRRLWWAIYSLERTLTVKLNRPRSVDQEVFSARLPQRLHSDSSQPFDNIEHQIANASFVRIIDAFIEPATWSSDSQPLLQEYEPLLKSWKRSLPPQLRLQNLDPKSPHYRAVFHIHLNYYFAWIAIGKTSVVSTIRAHLRPAVPGTTASGAAMADDTGKQFRSCNRAAQKMLHLLEGASNSGNFAPSSFTDFQSCSIATIILVLTGILERDSAYEANVAFGLGCLVKMANVHAAGRMAVSFVEALISIADEARAKLEANRTTRLAHDAEGHIEEYARWADWFSHVTEKYGRSKNVPSTSRGLPPNDPTTARAGTIDSPVWEEAAALLRLGNPVIASHTLASEHGALSSVTEDAEILFDASMDDSLPNITFTENHMQLMGLTGMDMLDFEFDL